MNKEALSDVERTSISLSPKVMKALKAYADLQQLPVSTFLNQLLGRQFGLIPKDDPWGGQEK